MRRDEMWALVQAHLAAEDIGDLDAAVAPGRAPGRVRGAAAAPGERAPHAWVELDGRRASTLDLYDGRLTLLSGGHGHHWDRVAERLATTGPPIKAYTVGQDLVDPDGELTSRYALDPDSAVLVRPDGYLAWRGGPAQALPAAVAIALGAVSERIDLAS